MMLFIDTACIMSLEGCSLTRDILSTNESNNKWNTTFVFFTNNLYGELGIAEIRATIVDYAQIDAML